MIRNNSPQSFSPVAPERSPSRLALLDFARKHGQDIELLRDILWLLIAHDHLVSFVAAARRINDILNIQDKDWQSALDGAGILEWQSTIEWVIQNHLALGDVIGGHFALEKLASGRHNPVLGKNSERCPLYTLLCEHLDPVQFDPRERDYFIRLSCMLLICQVRELKNKPSRSEYESYVLDNRWKPFPNDIYPATVAARRFSEATYLKHILDLPLDRDPESFIKSLENTPVPTVEPLKSDHGKLSRFILKCYGALGWRRRKPGAPTNGHGSHKWVGGRALIGNQLILEPQLLGDSADPMFDWGATDVVRQNVHSESRQKEIDSTDLSPDEFESDEIVIFSHYDCQSTKKDIGAFVRAARAKARHISIQNQMLPWSYDSLSLEEVALVMEQSFKIIKVFNAKSAPPASLRLLHETLCMLRIMLWTGSPLERVANVCLYLENTAPANGDLTIIVDDINAPRAVRFRIRAAVPEYKSQITGNAKQTRENQSDFELPALVEIFRRVKALIHDREKCEGMRLFVNTPAKLEKKALQWLKEIDPSQRITPSKITSFLVKQLTIDSGDSTVATAITGVPHRLSHVRLFYTTLSIKKIQQTYIETVTRLYHAASKLYRHNANLAPEWITDVAIDTAAGSRLCPLPEAINGYFDKLRQDIQISSGYTNFSGFVRYHNLYTLFTLQLFAYATSCRAIVTPYLALEDISPDRHLGSLSDKDDESSHKTRLVWLPPVAFEQMCLYDQHLSMLIPQLPFSKNTVLKEPCFFLDESGRPIEARPKNIEPRLERYIKVKANTHRRFLRTELLERQCPPEVIDAFLGHWQQGEEPFGKFSSFSINDYVKTLETHLVPLLKDIGLDRPIQSRLSA